MHSTVSTARGEEHKLIYAQLDWDLCQSCSPCTARKECQTRAIIKIASDEPAYIELERCMGCGKCVPACTWGAIQMVNPVRNNGHRPDERRI